MKLNRDVTILLLKQFPPMNICDPLAASGIRSIRFAKELKYKSIIINDLSKKAVLSIKKNIKLNKVKSKKIKVTNEDANLLLLNSKGFDYIDVDPFGTSNPYLETSIKKISRNGILAVTNTDTSALTGTYPKVCMRKYWSIPKKDYMMHETGLRILIRKIQLIGMQYDKALIPIFSYYKKHYFRIFFICKKGKKECDKIVKNHLMINDTGPLWSDQLWDKSLVNKIYRILINDKKMKIDSELLKFLKIIKEESKINVVGFYDMHKIAKNNKLKSMMKKENLIKKIRKKSYKATSTHFSGTGLRSDIAYRKLLTLLKE